MNKTRAFRFWLINTFVATIGIQILRLWTGTWKMDSRMSEELAPILTHPRSITAALHGSIFCLPALTRITDPMGTKVCALTSPSRDGLLQQRVLRAFGIGSVSGSSRSKGVAGSLGLIDAIRGGSVAFIIVDGPRGPVGVPKEGVARIAIAADAQVICVSVGCSRAIRFKSWDGAFLPLPFATLTYRFHVIPVGSNPGRPVEQILAEVRTALVRNSRELQSPIGDKLPPDEDPT